MRFATFDSGIPRFVQFRPVCVALFLPVSPCLPSSSKTFSEDEQAAAPQLEPSLESLFRSRGVHEKVIMACRCQDVLTRRFFVALDSTEEGLKDAAREAFGIDVSRGFPHKREFAKLSAIGHKSKEVDAVTRAHGELVTQLPADWESMMTKFKAKFGMDSPEFHLPGQSYFEAFEEKLNEGRLKPENAGPGPSAWKKRRSWRGRSQRDRSTSVSLSTRSSRLQLAAGTSPACHATEKSFEPSTELQLRAE